MHEVNVSRLFPFRERKGEKKVRKGTGENFSSASAAQKGRGMGN